MEIRKEILLNDQGLRMYVIIDENNNVSFEFDKNIEYLSSLVKLTDENNIGVILLGLNEMIYVKVAEFLGLG